MPKIRLKQVGSNETNNTRQDSEKSLTLSYVLMRAMSKIWRQRFSFFYIK